MGVAQIPHCENAMMLMLPGIWIAALNPIHAYDPYLYVILAVLINTFLYSIIPLLILRGRSYASIAKTSVMIGLVAISALLGCSTQKTTTKNPTPATTHYPTRPTTPPPPFKLFHQSPDTLTLTTTESASNTQIAALIYQLRDAANTHTFDSIHLPQSVIDARAPIIWFHIYRGPKCASEKYAAKLPCGPSYHAAGEFTLGSFHNPNRTDGELNLDENHTTALWNPDTVSQPKP